MKLPGLVLRRGTGRRPACREAGLVGLRLGLARTGLRFERRPLNLAMAARLAFFRALRRLRPLGCGTVAPSNGRRSWAYGPHHLLA